MKHLILVCLFLLPWSAYSYEEVGIGLLMGDPSGFSAKFLTDSDRSEAIDVALGWELNKRLYMHADYLFNQPKEWGRDKFDMDWYYGAGVKLAADYDHDNTAIALRAPLGASFYMKDCDAELFAELALTAEIIPTSHIGADAGIGFRYYID